MHALAESNAHAEEQHNHSDNNKRYNNKHYENGRDDSVGEKVLPAKEHRVGFVRPTAAQRQTLKQQRPALTSFTCSRRVGRRR